MTSWEANESKNRAHTKLRHEHIKKSGDQGLPWEKLLRQLIWDWLMRSIIFKTKELLLGALLEGFLLEYSESMQLLTLPKQDNSEKN